MEESKVKLVIKTLRRLGIKPTIEFFKRRGKIKMRVNLTSDDLARGTLVDPGWYACEIIKYEEKPATTDRSTNCISHLKIISGKFEGAGTKYQLNEKALGFGKNFFLALGAKYTTNTKGKQELVGVELTPALVGKKIDVYFARGTSNKGNDFNDAKDFAPLGVNSGYKAA